MKKITSFVMRNNRREVLLFEHEDGTIQIPAGTVEINEEILKAGIREAAEETGIDVNKIKSTEIIDYSNNDLKEDELVIEEKANVFSRPNGKSMSWGYIPRGITVKKQNEVNEYVQIRYDDWNNEVVNDYLSYSLIGWIEKGKCSNIKIRHYCIIDVNDNRTNWILENDNHTFYHHWISIESLPDKVFPDNEWIKVLMKYLGRKRPTTASA